MKWLCPECGKINNCDQVQDLTVWCTCTCEHCGSFRMCPDPTKEGE